MREYAEECLAEYHADGSFPTPIEEIVEFDFGMDIIPIPGLKAEKGLAREFKVSDQTMTIRLEKDGLLPLLSKD